MVRGQASFEKKERAKEVAELEQTISGNKEELADILHQQIAAGQETEQIHEMTDMEKKVMVRLCAKIVADTDLYETDKKVQNLIDWVCLSEQIKENNNTIRNLTGEYKK